jgi:hypothetical protein
MKREKEDRGSLKGELESLLRSSKLGTLQMAAIFPEDRAFSDVENIYESNIQSADLTTS